MIVIMTKITVTIRVALRRVPSMLRQDNRIIMMIIIMIMMILIMVILIIMIMIMIRVALRRVPSMLRQDSRVKLRRHSLVASPRLVGMRMVMMRVVGL